jgi:hypothetical protein
MKNPGSQPGFRLRETRICEKVNAYETSSLETIVFSPSSLRRAGCVGSVGWIGRFSGRTRKKAFSGSPVSEWSFRFPERPCRGGGDRRGSAQARDSGRDGNRRSSDPSRAYKHTIFLYGERGGSRMAKTRRSRIVDIQGGSFSTSGNDPVGRDDFRRARRFRMVAVYGGAEKTDIRERATSAGYGRAVRIDG